VKTLHRLYHLTRADFIERVRRSSFLLVLATAVCAGYLFVPPEGAGYHVLQVGVQRGIYNSAWIGLMFGLIAALHLPLVGFYLVKNAVERDRQTGVGQIIASTPTGRLVYVVGKWLSNLAVLVSILCVMTAMAAVMQLVRGEDATVSLWALVGPIWLMGMPMLMIAAAMAVLFECVPFLRGGWGNVAFFFLWLGIVGVVISSAVDEATELAQVIPDPYGYSRQLVDIQGQVLADAPDANVGTGLIIVSKDIERTFVWKGIDWLGGIILERALWAAVGVVIVLAAAIPFDRFDPARSRLKPEREGSFPRARERLGAIGQSGFLRRPSDAAEGIATSTVARLTPLVATPNRGRFRGVLAAELKLMLKGRGLLWYAGASGLIIACLVSPLAVVQRYLLPAVWVCPVLVWSQMGVRERRYNTGQMVFSTPRPVSRQLPALWLAGVVLAFIAGSGAGLRLALAGEITSLLAWCVGALFVPALALALGVWVGHSRAFEIVYLFWWYIGLINRVPAFDYAGATAGGLAQGMPLVYLGITVGLVALAVGGRKRQLATW
jgi:hypothetical protein